MFENELLFDTNGLLDDKIMFDYEPEKHQRRVAAAA